MRSSLFVACDEKPSCYLRIITNTVSSALLDERVTGGLGKGVVCRVQGRRGRREGRKRNVGQLHTLSKGDPRGKAPVSGVAMRGIVDFAATRGRCRVTTKVQIRLHWILHK